MGKKEMNKRKREKAMELARIGHLEVVELVEDLHVELVVLLRRQLARAQLAQHGGEEAQRLAHVVLVHGLAHLERAALYVGARLLGGGTARRR